MLPTHKNTCQCGIQKSRHCIGCSNQMHSLNAMSTTRCLQIVQYSCHACVVHSFLQVNIDLYFDSSKASVSFNPNSHKGLFVSRLSPRKGRGPKMRVPLDTNRGCLAPQCTVHPWHATRVSLPEQRFCAHMIPSSMT